MSIKFIQTFAFKEMHVQNVAWKMSDILPQSRFVNFLDTFHVVQQNLYIKH